MSNALNITPTKYIKLIELGKYFLIMNSIYDKDNLSCISKVGIRFEDITVGTNIINISRYMMLSGNYNGTYRHHDFGVVQDPYISNRYYSMLDNRFTNANTDMATANTRNWILTTEEDGVGGLSIINKITFTNYIFDKIIDIDETYLYVSAFYHNKDANYTYSGAMLFKINKNTGEKVSEIISSKNGARSNINLVYKDQDSFCVVYFYYDTSDYTSGDRGYLRMVKYNKSTQTKIASGTRISTGYKNFLATDVEDLFKVTNSSDFFYVSFHSNNKFITLALRPNSVTSDSSNVYTSSYTFSVNDPITVTFDNKFSITKRIWIKDGYIYAAIYDEASTTSSTMMSGQGIYTFKINYNSTSASEHTCIGKTTFSDSKNVVSLIFDKNKKILLVGYYESFAVYVYNDTNYMYEPTGTEVSNVLCAGFDEANTLWYETKNYGIHCLDLTNPKEVNIQFAKILYSYEGEDIHTYLTFSATSYLNEPAIGRYILVLSDNAYFDASNDNELKINYTGDDTVQYPLTIIGTKRLECTAQFENVWD